MDQSQSQNTKSLWDSLVFINKEDVLRKKQICESCEHVKMEYICSQCGCIIPFKIQLYESKCPINKW